MSNSKIFNLFLEKKNCNFNEDCINQCCRQHLCQDYKYCNPARPCLNFSDCPTNCCDNKLCTNKSVCDPTNSPTPFIIILVIAIGFIIFFGIYLARKLKDHGSDKKYKLILKK